MITIDHILISCANVQKSKQSFSDKFGAPFEIGGAHPGQGTMNALGSFGDGAYCELIGPDPNQSAQPHWLKNATDGALFHWAANCSNLSAVAEILEQNGLGHSGVIDGQRNAENGALLKWRVLFPEPSAFGALLPFFIDWQDTPHPSQSSPVIGSLKTLSFITPTMEKQKDLFSELGFSADIEHGNTAGLQATISTVNGDVRIRSADPLGDGVSPFDH
ncbi:MAG: VOC family protein [Pseudomonadota bacterium]